MLTEEQAFILLKRRILKDRGIDCEQYKERYLKRRIATRLRASGARDYLEYTNILKKNPEEYEFLVAALTINVTEFFRDHDVYQKLLDNVVPDLLERKRAVKSRSLRVWSAGCASGEEAYSVAMIIYQILGEGFGGWNVRILGTDIDEKSLAVAERGVYSQVKTLEGMNQSRFFSEAPREDGKVFEVRREIKEHVKFMKMDILSEEPRPRFDLVLCRNVLIYFNVEKQTKMLRLITSRMLREGYLVIGKSETLRQEVSSAFKTVFPRERIYKYSGAKGL